MEYVMKISYSDYRVITTLIFCCRVELRQVINHGVSENLMDDAMNLFEEFFNLPAEAKASVFPEDPSGSCKLYTSSFNYANEETHFWRDSLRHPCYPFEEFMQFLPEKPTRYRYILSNINP